MTDQDFRALNAELGFPPEAADRLLHDRRADERRERANGGQKHWGYPEALRYAFGHRSWHLADEGIEI